MKRAGAQKKPLRVLDVSSARKRRRDSELRVRNAVQAGNVKLKRAYELATPADGMRVLVDGLWPRGVKKADAAIDRWAKGLAPSAALRRWFGHDPERWQLFRERYARELRGHADEIEELRMLARQGRITLIFAARDQGRNNAVVLRELLLGG